MSLASPFPPMPTMNGNYPFTAGRGTVLSGIPRTGTAMPQPAILSNKLASDGPQLRYPASTSLAESYVNRQNLATQTSWPNYEITHMINSQHLILSSSTRSGDPVFVLDI